MKKNIGSTDKAVRVLAGIAIALFYYFNIISGTLALILMTVAVILLITSFINFCPLYSIFKISSIKKK